MRVNVKMHGVLGRGGAGRMASFDLSVHDDVTAGDLVHILGEHCGAPFRDAVDTSQSLLPRHIRIFSDGEMLSTLDQPLASQCTRAASVNIVVLSPMMGG